LNGHFADNYPFLAHTGINTKIQQPKEAYCQGCARSVPVPPPGAASFPVQNHARAFAREHFASELFGKELFGEGAGAFRLLNQAYKTRRLLRLFALNQRKNRFMPMSVLNRSIALAHHEPRRTTGLAGRIQLAHHI